jgi:hypothetical protein
MRSRGILALAAALAVLVTTAPASDAAQRGTVGRTTTVRAGCVGGGRIVAKTDQPGDGSVTVTATASNLPLDTTWDGTIQVDSAAGGGGSGFGDTQPDSDGTITSDVTVAGVSADPVVRVNFHTQDGLMVCIVRTRVDRQWARTSCSLSGRLLSATAEHAGIYLDVTSKLEPVRPRSDWNALASVRSPHASEGAAAATHASADGVLRFDATFGYAANRTVTVSFTNAAGHGCGLTMGTHRLPTG